jgi:NAD(P)-dependent dehydrogenase (short-subunit alcohol dehydrogenase family)
MISVDEIAAGGLVVVTGATRGIGRETALWFARRGYRIALTYRWDAEAAAGVVEECRSAGAPAASAHKLDFADPGTTEELIRHLKKRSEPIEVLINNAGMIVWRPLAEQTEDEIRLQIGTNLIGAILLTRALLGQARVILNVASDLSRFGLPELTVYCASKFGLRGFTQALAAERPDRRILCVNPDRTATGMNDFQGRDPRQVAEVIGEAALGLYDIPSGGDVDVPARIRSRSRNRPEITP